ncbi:FMN-dependent NADH-azoreductase [Alkalithermobacter paradoxus]|uniref:FMN dependent NADH:quinone oxidoreductase n=1 Tax=Alkalithermobacter paradoxus TaxID=29349 RepID=A0A1V4I7R0_9FIRM|nr:FMN-dependent NADH-azoreductase 2 [[Clostridium] thermoalcaliphilum]
MKKLLYITCNSKPESISASKTVGREFINAFLEINSNLEFKELDLYQMHIPRLKHTYFDCKNGVVDSKNNDSLSQDEKREIDNIIQLATEFKDADIYVIAAPMWNLMFPAPLKEYIDCIIQNDITVKIDADKISGLLDDKERSMIYIQSSGGGIPWLLDGKINHGGNYLEDLFKFVGIKNFHEILVDKTGYTGDKQHEAVEKAKEQARALAQKLS